MYMVISKKGVEGTLKRVVLTNFANFGPLQLQTTAVIDPFAWDSTDLDFTVVIRLLVAVSFKEICERQEPVRKD